MNEITKRIELVALAQKNSFMLDLVKNRHDAFLRVIKEANENSIDLKEFKDKKEIQRLLLDNERFMSDIVKLKKSYWFTVDDFEQLLLEIKENDDCVLNYSADQLCETVNLKKYLSWKGRMVYHQYFFLKYFSGKNIAERKKQRLAQSIIKLYSNLVYKAECFEKENCVEILSSKYYSDAWLVQISADTLNVIMDNENARKFLVFLYSKGFRKHDFNANELKKISDNFDVLIPDLKKIFAMVGFSNFSKFIDFWHENDLGLNEVKLLVKQLSVSGYEPAAFVSKVNYINFLCGNKLKDFRLEHLSPCLGEVLIYAILNNKKGFLRLVKENFNIFSTIPQDTVLANEIVYKFILNLNALNYKNLQDISRMYNKDFNGCNFDDRNYTFDEFRTLYSEDDQYGKVYNLLTLERVDDRLVVVKELCKHHLLPPDLSEAQYKLIAEKLSIKPLSRWHKENYSDISDLALRDVVYILANFELIEKFRKEIKSCKDVYCIIRNRRYAVISKSLKDLVNNILKNDIEWLELKETMNLSCEFIKENKKTIAEFVFNGNATIANKYYPCLQEKYKDAFFRVVKAEMLGKLKELKYFPGDITKEIDYAVTETQEQVWSQNSVSGSRNIEVRECDGFETTMTLGINPLHTCMAYDNGEYRECLISNFDSNKKILYAYINGVCVARAILRLTKGSYKDGEAKFVDEGLKFADINENGDFETHVKVNEDEHLTVFLERMYCAGVNTSVVHEIESLFVELAIKKAKQLDAECVISTQYSSATKAMPYTSYRMYISRSKSGNQYLDSLGGSASVSSERTMKNTVVFIARRQDNG